MTWSVEEFYAVYGDDDKEFVGTLSSTGLFTPGAGRTESAAQIQPQQLRRRLGGGDRQNEKDKDGKPLSGKSYLVVTVPTYIRWDQPEVGK